MGEIPSQRRLDRPHSAGGWRALAADLRALAGQGDATQRRRGVALRLVAAGLTRDALEAVLPGWGHYLDGRRPVRVESSAELG